jgi:serine/threonine protein kinase
MALVWEKVKVLNPNGYIHKGVFGTVWKAKHTLDGNTYAVKQIPIADTLRLRNDGIQGLLQEVTSLNKISSENVVKYHFCWVEGPDAQDISLDSSHVPEGLVPELTSGPSPVFQPNYLYIQMEYCELDLERWLKLPENLSPETRVQVVKGYPGALLQLARGLKAIHDQKLVHGDLKPDNILLKMKRSGMEYIWKIGDLGLSKEAQPDHREAAFLASANAYGQDNSINLTSTVAYSALDLSSFSSSSSIERLSDKQTQTSDVYYLGLIFVRIMYPFRTKEELHTPFFEINIANKSANNGLNKLFKKLKTDFSVEVDYSEEIEVLKRMLVREAKKRWNINQVVNSLDEPAEKSDNLSKKVLVHFNSTMNPFVFVLLTYIYNIILSSLFTVFLQKNCTSLTVSHKSKKDRNVSASNISSVKPEHTHIPRPLRYKIGAPVSTFTGRHAELREIASLLSSKKTKMKSGFRNVVVLEGLGGIGKTNLARRFAQVFSQQCGGDVIWIMAESPSILSASWKDLFTIKLKKDWDTSNISSSLQYFYSIFHNWKIPNPSRRSKDELNPTEFTINLPPPPPTLIIFDNAEILKKKGSSSPPELFDYLPHSQTEFFNDDFIIPYFLITTRRNEFILNAEKIKLKPLRTEEAVEFVNTVLECMDPSDEDCLALCETLQNFPLALQQAVAYIRENFELLGYTIEKYIKEFQTTKAKLLLDFDHTENTDDTYEWTTLITWNISLEKISSTNDRAMDVMHTIAFLPADNICIQFVKSLLNNGDENEFDDSIFILPQKYSMYTLQKGLISVHRLVQKVIQISLRDKNGQDIVVLRRILHRINSTIEDFHIKSDQEETPTDFLDAFVQASGVDAESSLSIPYVLCIWKHCQRYPDLLREFFQFPLSYRSKLIDRSNLDNNNFLSSSLDSTIKAHSTDREFCVEVLSFYGYETKLGGKFFPIYNTDECTRWTKSLYEYHKKYVGIDDPLTETYQVEYFSHILSVNPTQGMTYFKNEVDRRIAIHGKSDESKTLDFLITAGACTKLYDPEFAITCYRTVLEERRRLLSVDANASEVTKEIVKAMMGIVDTYTSAWLLGLCKNEEKRPTDQLRREAIDICRALYDLRGKRTGDWIATLSQVTQQSPLTYGITLATEFYRWTKDYEELKESVEVLSQVYSAGERHDSDSILFHLVNNRTKLFHKELTEAFSRCDACFSLHVACHHSSPNVKIKKIVEKVKLSD